MPIKINGPLGLSAEHIFVYDELKHKGKQNHILVSTGCKFVKKASLSKFELYNILNSYPMMISTTSSKEFTLGEIWTIGHAALFDSLDSIKSPMDRHIFDVFAGKELFRCWTYFMPSSKFNPDAPGVRKNRDNKWKI